MRYRLNLKNIFLFGFALFFIVGCKKIYKDGYVDGTPKDGPLVSGIAGDTMLIVDKSKYARAALFPGLVCAQEARISVTVTLDLNYNFVNEGLRISVPPQPQFSTGLYEAPGELVKIDVPANEYSLSVQIGAWTDDLSFIPNAPRDPIIYTKTQLAPGRNYVRNLYGGHIYIFAARPITTSVAITFSNVVKSPDFVLGKTSNADWQTAVSNSCVPFLELRSQNIVFVVPREYCLGSSIPDVNKLMTHWDSIINIDYYQWEGLEAAPADPIDKAPLLAWRVVQDIKPVAGYGHSGFPVVTYNNNDWFDEFTNLERVGRGWSWGTLHEIGHNNQQSRYWSWSSLGETSNNLFAFKVAHRALAEYPNAWDFDLAQPGLTTDFVKSPIIKAMAFAADGSKTITAFDEADPRINDPFSRLTPFLQLFDGLPANWGYTGQPEGWDIMKELYKKARRATRFAQTDQDMRDFFFETVCDFTHRDMLPFFNAWAILVSNISTDKMAQKWPLMDLPAGGELWRYNPMNHQYIMFVAPDPFVRSNWNIAANSEQLTGEGSGNGPATAMLDDNLDTYWHSSYSSGGSTTPPFIITVFLGGGSAVINGFAFAQRQSGTGTARAVKNIEVETSTDGNSWAIAGTFALQDIQGLQNFTLPGTITAKYFRLTISTVDDIYDGTPYASLSEINIIKP